MSRKTYAQAIRDAIAAEMERDPEIFLIGEDIGESGGVFGVTQGLHERFGDERVLDTPISEEALTGAGVGAALLGGRPVVEIMFSDFVMLAMDMIANQAAKTHYMTGGRLNVPMVVRLVTGTAGATAAQHSQSLEAWFTHVPGLKVVAPSTPEDAYRLMLTALRDPDPVIFLEHKQLYGVRGEMPDELDAVPLGEGRLARQGEDVTVVSYLKTLHQTLEAADELEEEGISVEVFDPRSLAPFDRGGLRDSLARTGRLVVAHEAVQRSGFGAEVSAIVAESCFELLKAPIVRVCGFNTPVPYAPEFEDHVLPGPGRIAEGIRRAVSTGR